VVSIPELLNTSLTIEVVGTSTIEIITIVLIAYMVGMFTKTIVV
jgi:hypothetical protein